ncbi:kinase-like domain-containing protein [Rhodocollybia butyracea]|uniref:Kinase-like domain-containing protein n=1 Tax=Rhodocollybia butyracea TaxID=206335 RepID=A0A9P5UC16_9AGAR|nr:kinase-like domain-containing protein [Rhodocollybia butyracea]
MGFEVGPNVEPGTGTLYESEVWWAEHCEWLKERGYLLRPRYRPGWEPSWQVGKDTHWLFEDGQETEYSTEYIMDAVRISDSLVVCLKHVSLSTRHDGSEERVAILFSNEQHNANPLNHCIRVLEVLQVPDNDDERIIVTIWMRGIMSPSFRTIGEVLQFFKEMIEGLQYMHRNNVAHRDCSVNNMVMDARSMYTRQWHPNDPKKRYDWSGRALHHSRTRRPPRYYLIDFGFSRECDPSRPRPPELAIRSGGYFPPEAREDTPCDPFATDVFLLGNMMYTAFLEGDDEFHLPGIHGLAFLEPLVEDMMNEDPTKRPTMDEVASRFSAIVKKLPWWKLRSRAAKKDEFPLFKPFRAVYHFLWTSSMMLMLKPAIPSTAPNQ